MCNIRNKKCCKPCDPFIIPVLHPALWAIIVTFTWFILLSLAIHQPVCTLFNTLNPQMDPLKCRALCLCLWKYTSVTQREDADDNPALLSSQANPDRVTEVRGMVVYSKVPHRSKRRPDESDLQRTCASNNIHSMVPPPNTPQVPTWHFLIALNVNKMPPLLSSMCFHYIRNRTDVPRSALSGNVSSTVSFSNEIKACIESFRTHDKCKPCLMMLVTKRERFL